MKPERKAKAAAGKKLSRRVPHAGGAVLKAGDFKARALAVMRRVHETGEAVTVTSHGRALVRIEALREAEPTGYGCMRGTFELLVREEDAQGDPTACGTLDEWEADKGAGDA